VLGSTSGRDGDARKFARKSQHQLPLVHDNHDVTSPKYGLTGLRRRSSSTARGELVGHVARRFAKPTCATASSSAEVREAPRRRRSRAGAGRAGVASEQHRRSPKLEAE
jgi:hypothetical protein